MTLPKRILVFRNGSIGNTLAAVPALRCLRTSFPGTRIAVMVDKIGYELLENCPYFDSLLVYDRNGSGKGVSGFMRIVNSIRQEQPDSCILFKRFFRNGLLARLSGATRRIGFSTDGKAPFLNETIPYDESVHVAELNLRLVKAMGASAEVAASPEVFIKAGEQNEAQAWLHANRIENAYLIAHFGGVTGGAEFVPHQLRIDLIKALARDLPIVLIGNGSTEQQAAKDIKIELANSVDATNLPLRQSMALIAGAHRFIGTNSGPMHIAAAANISGIALFKEDDRYEVERVKWRPLHETLKIVPVSPMKTHSEIVDLARQTWLTI